MGGLVYRRHLGAAFSEGSRLLWLAMVRGHLSQEALRREMRCSKGAISRYLRGERRPDGPARGFFHRRFRIAPDAWDKKPSRKFSPVRVAA